MVKIFKVRSRTHELFDIMILELKANFQDKPFDLSMIRILRNNVNELSIS